MPSLGLWLESVRLVFFGQLNWIKPGCFLSALENSSHLLPLLRPQTEFKSLPRVLKLNDFFSWFVFGGEAKLFARAVVFVLCCFSFGDRASSLVAKTGLELAV